MASLSLPTIAEMGVEDHDSDIMNPVDEDERSLSDDGNEDGYHNAAGILASPSANQTPYQIFRAAKKAAQNQKDDEEGDEEQSKENNSIVPIDIDIPYHHRKLSRHNTETDDDFADDAPTATTPRNQSSNNDTNGFPGFLSPNSVEIRQNALKLLEQRPSERRNRKKKVDKNRRRSMPLQPLSSLMNIQAPTVVSTSFSKSNTQNSSINKSNNNSGSSKNLKDVEQSIKKELEADFEEIKEVAKSVANMASKASNDAFEAFSSGARNVIGQLWD